MWGVARYKRAHFLLSVGISFVYEFRGLSRDYGFEQSNLFVLINCWQLIFTVLYLKIIEVLIYFILIKYLQIYIGSMV